MAMNNWFSKDKQIEIAQSLTDAQRHHIKVATELGYFDQQIARKLKLTIGEVYAVQNCIKQGWKFD
jgi:hypothetical protein